MKINAGVQPHAGTSFPGLTDSVPEPSLIDAVRGVGVTFGPSLALDLLVAASVGILAKQDLGARSDRRAERILGPLAGLGVGLTMAYLLVIRPRLRRWGATGDEVQRTLPGDEAVPDPAIDATWAVTIDAPVREVWPWLAQIGQDRGGFYSYEWLENLAGCKISNADRVHPEWQHREIGEIVRLVPAFGLAVVRFEPDRALVLDAWGAFVLEALDGQTTRLISRSRVAHGWRALFYTLVLEVPHFVMQREMLLGIKQRAEAARRSQTGRVLTQRAGRPDVADV